MQSSFFLHQNEPIHLVKGYDDRVELQYVKEGVLFRCHQRHRWC